MQTNGKHRLLLKGSLQKQLMHFTPRNAAHNSGQFLLTPHIIRGISQIMTTL
jgi:hypothetical protein